MPTAEELKQYQSPFRPMATRYRPQEGMEGGVAKGIDEDAMRATGQDNLRIAVDPQDPPTKRIEKMDFPRVVYKHPKQPFRRIEHRNAMQELVNTEVVPAEHLTKSVKSQAELEDALRKGWKLEPYIAPTPPDPNDDLYEADMETVSQQIETLDASKHRAKR